MPCIFILTIPFIDLNCVKWDKLGSILELKCREAIEFRSVGVVMYTHGIEIWVINVCRGKEKWCLRENVGLILILNCLNKWILKYYWTLCTHTLLLRQWNYILLRSFTKHILYKRSICKLTLALAKINNIISYIMYNNITLQKRICAAICMHVFSHAMQYIHKWE